MKGFPNQIADMHKLTLALVVIADRLAQSLPIDDGALGEALLWARVIRPQNETQPVDDYLRSMQRRRLSNQSHRTAARGLKEFFRLAGVIAINGITETGEKIVSASSANSSELLKDCWRDALRQIRIQNEQGASHPYQMLLRLLAERPDMPRSFAPLVFEAADDSESERQRIVSLLDIGDENVIRQKIGVTKTNWDNAKKILPALGVQAGDITETGGNLRLTDSALNHSVKNQGVREVTVDTIAQPTRQGEIGEWPRAIESIEIDPVSLRSAIAKRNERTRMHDELVRAFAKAVPDISAIWEGAIDLGAIAANRGILAEMKTLDGTLEDERSQVRLAVGQLLYYERFSLPESLKGIVDLGALVKVVVFNRRPSAQHLEWIESLGIAVAWLGEDGFSASQRSRRLGIDFL